MSNNFVIKDDANYGSFLEADKTKAKWVRRREAKGVKELHTDKKTLELSLEWVFAGRMVGGAGSWPRKSDRKKVKTWETAQVTQQSAVNGGTGGGTKVEVTLE